ncbi:MAG: hypothetical protein RE471_02965 [Ferroplasma sp.]|nr:hypothetical protein [Ferroplasma sp.]WMT51848.1 MAG: hypothetical protein RE471_02965 [Ferroplasma sp.]
MKNIRQIIEREIHITEIELKNLKKGEAKKIQKLQKLKEELSKLEETQ